MSADDRNVSRCGTQIVAGVESKVDEEREKMEVKWRKMFRASAHMSGCPSSVGRLFQIIAANTTSTIRLYFSKL